MQREGHEYVIRPQKSHRCYCTKLLGMFLLLYLLVCCVAVIRELDYLQRQEESKARSSSALEWIEACMLEMPSWIHVQSSADTVHVAMTPPVSPSVYARYKATILPF